MFRWRPSVRFRNTVVTGFAGAAPDGCWAARVTGRINATIDKGDGFMSSPGEGRRTARHCASRAQTAQRRPPIRHQNFATELGPPRSTASRRAGGGTGTSLPAADDLQSFIHRSATDAPWGLFRVLEGP